VGTVPAAGCALSLVDRVPAYGKRYYFLVRPVDDHGVTGVAYPLALIDVPLPDNRVLLNHNLFRPGPEHGQTLDVNFQVVRPGHVTLSVWTTTGEAVRRRAWEGDVTEPGIGEDAPYNTRDRQLHPFVWDGTNDAGDVVFSGVYLIVLEIGGKRDVRSVAVMR
ncbi:MAG: hypothetical protein AAB368_09870, partial [bacterium]